jgi:hypothetical protein
LNNCGGIRAVLPQELLQHQVGLGGMDHQDQQYQELLLGPWVSLGEAVVQQCQ